MYFSARISSTPIRFVPRLDAGRGLLLAGDGTGRLRPIPGQESGLLVDGEQRGAAVADFNEDGALTWSSRRTEPRRALPETGRPSPAARALERTPGPTRPASGRPFVCALATGSDRSASCTPGADTYAQDSTVLVLATPQLRRALSSAGQVELSPTWPSRPARAKSPFRRKGRLTAKESTPRNQ